MTAFTDAQNQMRDARAAIAAAQAALGRSTRELRALSVQRGTVSRQADKAAAAGLRERIGAAQAGSTQATADLAAARKQLQTAAGGFGRFLDPRPNLQYWSAAWPIALLPVRIETRFVTVRGDVPKRQLWVRIYPDDCWIDTFEPQLSASELDSAKRYWRAIWRAGGVEADQRAALRSLVSAHGSSRANYIADTYQPLNLADEPSKVKPTDEILVIPTQTPLNVATEAAAISAYWRAVWLANGDAGKINAALNALQVAVGVARATQLSTDYVPFNLDDVPASPLSKQHVGLSVAFLIFPPDPTTQPESWTQAPKVDQFPDCFVVLGFNAGAQTLAAAGTQITLPLYVGPDPQATPAQTIHPDNATGDLFVPDQLRWLVDFPSAVAAGMGLAIDLTPEQADAGFDRLLVLGVQLSASALDGEVTLGTLLGHHTTGRSGLELLPQGAPTHNTTGNSSGYGRNEDPDASFDDRKNAPLFSVTADPMKKRDGQWLAEALGVNPAVFYPIHGAGGLDQIQRRAMQQALWPATLGYWMDKLMTPVFSDDTVASTRWFFTNHVGGRGALPAIRIGGQPYGVLPTTAFSRIAWLTEGYRGKALALPGNQLIFLAQLYALLRKIDPDWTAMSEGASWVGKAGDPHQILLDIIGLHPTSVEFYSRYAETVAELRNLVNLADFGPTFAKALAAALQQVGASQLLGQLGYGGAPPDILQQLFDSDAALLAAVIDDRPFSETAPVRVYTDDGRNYLHWLLDAAKTSLDALRLEQGFSGNQTPQTLLYLWLRHALMLGYFDTSYFLHRSAGFLPPAQLAAMKPEPPFVHIDTAAPESESRFAALYKVEPRITGSPALLVSDYITANYGTLAEAQNFSEQLNALALLADAPTAALERLFAEHIDVCSYRFDSWLLGLVSVQLSAMRGAGSEEGQRGVYLGAYAWVEDLRPAKSPLVPVELPPDLAKAFGGGVQLMQDPANGGYIHAPSIPHARTAAVLRSGYLANATAANPGTMAVNLSSDRVRLALSILEGIRNGQSLGALLGYRFERGLHDDQGLAEVDKFIYPLRQAFPLVANAISDTKDPNAPIESLEARNVLDGRKLILQVQSSGNAAYPFGLGTLPAANPQEAAAIDAEVNRMLDAYDAVADLALAEGVHQAVQGNFDRIGATLDAYSAGNFPPDPEVVQSPANGVGLTHRVAVHLRPGLPAPPGAPPRASAEPALDDFLQRIFPALKQVACTVSWNDPVTNAAGSRLVSLDKLALRPIDILGLVLPDNTQAMAELDDRILDYVIATDNPRPDTKLNIAYRTAPANKISVFAFSALVRSVKSLLTRSRPLRASDTLLKSDATVDSDANAVIDRTRIAAPLAALATLSTDMSTWLSNLGALLADPVAHRDAIIAGVDALLTDACKLLERATRFALPQAGWGFVRDWKRVAFADLIAEVEALVTQWDERLADYAAKLAAYNALPAGTPDGDRFRALRAMELTVSTSTVPLPATPADLLATVQGKQANFQGARDQFNAITTTGDPSFANLFAAVKALLPISAYETQPFDLASFGDRAIVIAQDLQRTLKSQQTAIDARRAATQSALDTRDHAASVAQQTQAMQAAARALFGDGFTVCPEFPLDPNQASEWANAYASSTGGNLLKYLTQTAMIDFPVDEWLLGAARVRPALHAWEAVVNLATGFGVTEPTLTPVQLPYDPAGPWLAMQFPSTYELASDRLLYTAYYGPAGFDGTKSQCGLLLDEWSEVVPVKDSAAALPHRHTGITFNYNRPDSEAPQAILLVTPASNTEQWQWADLVGALNETLDLAKKRALEPAHIDQKAYASFLPATVMAATLYGISITTSLAAANGAFTQLRMN